MARKTERERRIVRIHLDEHSIARFSPDVEHERAVAIFDLLEDNSFAPAGDFAGPFVLYLSIAEGRLVIAIHDEADAHLSTLTLPTTPFRKLIKDYFTICESYYSAIRSARPAQIEAIDAGRRALHDEASQLLMERLEDKVVVDLATARRLFTLICVLHIRG